MLRKEEPHVVIVGGGFAGLAAARAFSKQAVRVTLIDRTNHHLFQPLLYQVATAALAAPDIAAPIRKLVRNQANTTVLMTSVEALDLEQRSLSLLDADGRAWSLHYDHLLLAAGMTHTYFGHDEWEEHAPGLKTLADALAIRARILRAFEAAERETDAALRREWTTFVVIGGGPTGVELAGALAEIAGRTLARDFRHFDPRTTRVVLVEGGERLLASFHSKLSESALHTLSALGIQVMLGRHVTHVDGHSVRIGDETIAARTVLWAAGVQASALTQQLGVPLDKAGRVKVEPDLSVPGHPEVVVLGDLVHLEQEGRLLPGVCQMGIQSGRHAALNFERRSQNLAPLPFRYHDKGALSTIGRARAVAEIGRLRLSGGLAWCLWLFVHILFLVEFRNRVAVLLEWGWAFLTWNRSSRVILDPKALNAVPASTLPRGSATASKRPGSSALASAATVEPAHLNAKLQ